MLQSWSCRSISTAKASCSNIIRILCRFFLPFMYNFVPRRYPGTYFSQGVPASCSVLSGRTSALVGIKINQHHLFIAVSRLLILGLYHAHRVSAAHHFSLSLSLFLFLFLFISVSVSVSPRDSYPMAEEHCVVQWGRFGNFNGGKRSNLPLFCLY